MKIGHRDKIALGGAVVAVVLYLVFQFVLFPAWDSMQEQSSNLPDQEAKLRKYLQIAQTATARSAEASNVDARLREAEGSLLASKSPALASAEMQQLGQQLTAAVSIEFRTSEFLAPKPLSDDYTAIPLGLQFQCRLDQLLDLLKAIGESPKVLAIPRIQIQAMVNKEKLLNVSLQISGIMRAEPAKKDGSK